MNSMHKGFMQTRKGIQVLSGIAISVVLLALVLSIGGCSTQTNEPIEATWVTAWVVGDTVSIPVSEVEDSKIIHFELSASAGDTAFMAYELGGKMYMRSNVCPPCRSVGFSLQRDILVCDTCQTTFNAKTGVGIEGACVDYPKASVPYEITDGNIVMSEANLIAAYQDTLQPR